MTLIILALNGCANYSGLHPQSQLLTQQQIFSPQYNTGQKLVPTWQNNAWWTEFNDPFLNQLIAQGLSGSPNIKLAEARVRLACAQANEAQANSMPLITGDGYVYRTYYSTNSIYPPPFGGTWHNFSNLELDFSYEFDFWHKNQQTIAAALGAEAAAQANAESAKLILASAIAQTYFQIRGDNNLIVISNENIAAQAALVHLLKLQEHAEIISSYQVEQAQQTLSTLQVDLSQLKQQRQNNIDQLNTLVGRIIPDNSLTRTLVNNNKIYPLPKTIPLNLLGRRPDLVALRWSAVAASHKINAAKAAFYPDINLTGFLGLQSLALNNLFEANSRNMQFGPAISLPIFDAGRLRANLGIQDAQYDIAVEQYNQGLLKAVQQTLDSLTQLRAVINQQQQQAQAFAAIENNYHYSLSQYHAGTADLLNVLTTQQQLLQSQQQTVQLYLQHQIAVVKLMQALGGGYQSSVDFSRA